MAEFLKVKTSEEVLEIIAGFEPLESEELDLVSARGRVLAEEVRSHEPLPHFRRATMDGFAVRARDTFGASESLPALLESAGEVLMGQAVSAEINPGNAITIPTGGMLPEGSDAVVMVEYTSPLDLQTIEVTRPVAPGDNVLQIGEDVSVGEVLFPRGWRLRPQDLGMLAAVGYGRVWVHRRPRVAVVSTGDEVVSVETLSVPMGKIRDINTVTLAGQVEECGAVVGLRTLVTDSLEALVETCRTAMEDHDVVLLSGGSSVGVRDYTLRILESFPDAELLVHGIAIRPGKPTILARIGKKIFWGLPGQPVSALMICRIFAVPSLERLEGLVRSVEVDEGKNTLSAVLSRQLPSLHGRTDCVPVALSIQEGELMATPVFGKSAMIGILAKAHGYIMISEHVEGLDQGTRMRVQLFSRF
jgi:molybdopterin molybdotransferase